MEETKTAILNSPLKSTETSKGRSLSYVMLHSLIFVPGATPSQYGPAITLSKVTGKNQAQSMTLNASGDMLTMMFDRVEVLVPATSVSHMIVAK